MLDRNPSGIPAPETNFAVNAAGIVTACLTLYCLAEYWPGMNRLHVVLWVIGMGAIPMLLADVFYYRIWQRPSTGLGRWRTPDLGRIAIKLLGLAGVFAFYALLYALFNEYHKPFYNPFWEFLRLIAPVAAVVTVPYFYLVDGLQKDPEDAYYHTGRLLLGRLEKNKMSLIGANLRNWLVKAYFLPLMLVFFMGNAGYFVNFTWAHPTNAWQTIQFLINFTFLVDLVYGAMGYMMTFRVLDAHIRSSEPTVAGWMAALICYPPFVDSVMFNGYLNYHDGFEWGNWLEKWPIIYMMWGQAIVVLLAIYSSATISFGYRFSNLTYRGIMTNGPYRFTKHPAYVAKNLSWWLISVPFIPSQGWRVAVAQCLLLLGVNIIYYLRAITEERHLSRYPEYVQYGLAMNNKSIFAPVAKILPFLQYKAPKH